jgi:peroxiredoxin
MKNSICLLVLLCSSIMMYAQTSVPDFKLPNVRDGKVVSLSSYSSSKAVVIIFTSHECPFDNYYKDRIKDLINAYNGKLQFLLVNSNLETQENPEQMSIHYTDLAIPYLADKDQAVMESLGAKKTPEVFVLTNNGGKFSVAYSGAIDDNPQSSKDVRNYFLKNAIENVLAGSKPSSSNERAMGCTIRKK